MLKPYGRFDRFVVAHGGDTLDDSPAIGPPEGIEYEIHKLPKPCHALESGNIARVCAVCPMPAEI